MTPPTDPSYTAQALRTESPITPALQTRLQQHARLVHAVLGLQTEAGELADPVKKHIYYGRPLNLVNLREEIGDCLWYLAIAADALGTTIEAEQARNLAKLRTRYPHVFTAEAAQVRDLDREREVLEKDVADDPHTLRQQLADAQRAVSDALSEVNCLREQLDAARAETVEMRAQRDEALNMAAEFSGTGPQFWNRIEVVKYNAEQSVKERAAAHQTILLQRAGIERLQAFVENVRNADCYADVLHALAELDAEPTPVAEPLDGEKGQ